jgi:phosphoglycerate kinase
MNLKSHLSTWQLDGKRVFLRADLNVPFNNNGTIIHDHRLQALLPTLKLIREKKGKTILATHIGRPESYTRTLSTQLLASWFERHGYPIDFEPDLDAAYEKSFINPEKILLLENLRFFPGEKTADNTFAQQLARLGDYYINDAFATLHRNHASITVVPTFFTPEKRTIGLLVEKELRMLEKLVIHPAQPFVVIIGGAKIADKIPMLNALLSKVSTILLGPAIVFTFLKALGKPVGNSLVDDHALELCITLLETAKKNGVSVLFPTDYLVAEKNFTGPLSVVASDNLHSESVGISIGPKTAHCYAQEIMHAKTIFFNGLMGDATRRETLQGAEALFQAMANSNGFSVIGGGDSVGAAYLLGIAQNISYISTGGSAALTYMSGQSLAGLAPFIDDHVKIQDKN